MNDETLEIQTIDWGGLIPQAARDVLYLLHTDEDLLATARAMANDDVDTIRALLQSGKLQKPADSELAGDRKRWFQMVIVQPFVLAQRVVEGE